MSAIEKKPDRNDLRSTIFATHAPQSRQVNFFGATIELRQSNLGDILDARDAGDERKAMVTAFIRQAYVPGTDEKVFDEEDVPSLLAMPFGPDFVNILQAIAELTGVNFAAPRTT
jgi:hypothetical protein